MADDVLAPLEAMLADLALELGLNVALEVNVSAQSGFSAVPSSTAMAFVDLFGALLLAGNGPRRLLVLGRGLPDLFLRKRPLAPGGVAVLDYVPV